MKARFHSAYCGVAFKFDPDASLLKPVQIGDFARPQPDFHGAADQIPCTRRRHAVRPGNRVLRAARGRRPHHQRGDRGVRGGQRRICEHSRHVHRPPSRAVDRDRRRRARGGRPDLRPVVARRPNGTSRHQRGRDRRPVRDRRQHGSAHARRARARFRCRVPCAPTRSPASSPISVPPHVAPSMRGWMASRFTRPTATCCTSSCPM